MRKITQTKVHIEVHSRDTKIIEALLAELDDAGWGHPVKGWDISWSPTDNGRKYEFLVRRSVLVK